MIPSYTSNLYAFGVSEILPDWKWSSHHNLQKNIIGFRNIIENSNEAVHVTMKHNTSSSESQPNLSQIEEEEEHPTIRQKRSEIRFIAIYAGESQVFLETENHDLVGFGYNVHNILGLGENIEKTMGSSRKVLTIGSKIKFLSITNEAITLLTNSNKLFGWGINKNNQLSDANTKKYDQPTYLRPKLSLERNPAILKEYEAQQLEEKKHQKESYMNLNYSELQFGGGSKADISMLKHIESRQNFCNEFLNTLPNVLNTSVVVDNKSTNKHPLKAKKVNPDELEKVLGPVYSSGTHSPERKNSMKLMKQNSGTVTGGGDFEGNQHNQGKTASTKRNFDSPIAVDTSHKNFQKKNSKPSGLIVGKSKSNHSYKISEEFPDNSREILQMPNSKGSANKNEKSKDFGRNQDNILIRPLHIQQSHGPKTETVFNKKGDTSGQIQLNSQKSSNVNEVIYESSNLKPRQSILQNILGDKPNNQQPQPAQTAANKFFINKKGNSNTARNPFENPINNPSNNLSGKFMTGRPSNQGIPVNSVNANQNHFAMNERMLGPIKTSKNDVNRNSINLTKDKLNLTKDKLNLTKDKLNNSRMSNSYDTNKAPVNFHGKSTNKLDSSRNSIMQNLQKSKVFMSTFVKENTSDNKPVLLYIETNAYCTYYITNLGVFSIGNKETGLLGFNNTHQLLNYPIPIDISPHYKIIGLSASAQHVLAWDFDGRLFSWGSNHYNKLGIKEKENKTGDFILKPTLVDLLEKKKVYSALAGINSSFIITNKGTVYYWGKPFVSFEGKGSIWKSPNKLECPKLKEEKINYIKLTSFGYNYVALDIKGRVFTFGENYQENLGHRSASKSYMREECNYLEDLNDLIVFDIGITEKNVFLQAESKTRKSMNLFLETDIVKKYIDKSKEFTKHILKDLKSFKQEFHQKKDRDCDNKFQVGGAQPKLSKDNDDESNDRTFNFDNIDKNTLTTKTYYKRKEDALNDQPFQPSTRKKIITEFSECNQVDLNEDENMEGGLGAIDNMELQINYHNYLKNEMNHSKADTHVRVQNYDLGAFSLRMNQNPLSNEKLEYFHDYNILTSDIRKEVFGEFNDTQKTKEEYECLRQQIELDKETDQKDIYMEAIRNGKETEQMSYQWSKGRFDDGNQGDDFRKFLKGTGSSMFADQEIYAKAKKEQTLAKGLSERACRLSKQLFIDIVATRCRLEKKWRVYNANSKQKFQQTTGLFFETKQDQIKKIKKNMIKTNKSLASVMIKKKDVHNIQQIKRKTEYEDKTEVYNKRMALRELKKRMNVELLGMFSTLLMIKYLGFFQNFIIKTMRGYHSSKYFLDIQANVIQKFIRKKLYRQIQEAKNNKLTDAPLMLVSIQELKNARSIKNMILMKPILSIFNRMKVPMAFYLQQGKTLQRFFRKKLEVIYFERCVLAFHFIKKMKLKFWKDKKGESQTNLENYDNPNQNKFEPLYAFKRILDHLSIEDNLLTKEDSILTTFSLKYEKVRIAMTKICENCDGQVGLLGIEKKPSIFWRGYFKTMCKNNLPFSQERELYSLPKKFYKVHDLKEYGLSEETVVVKSELESKMGLIKLYHENMIQVFNENFREFIRELRIFADKNMNAINECRAREMLRIGPKRLKAEFVKQKMALIHKKRYNYIVFHEKIAAKAQTNKPGKSYKNLEMKSYKNNGTDESGFHNISVVGPQADKNYCEEIDTKVKDKEKVRFGNFGGSIHPTQNNQDGVPVQDKSGGGPANNWQYSCENIGTIEDRQGGGDDYQPFKHKILIFAERIYGSPYCQTYDLQVSDTQFDIMLMDYYSVFLRKINLLKFDLTGGDSPPLKLGPQQKKGKLSVVGNSPVKKR